MTSFLLFLYLFLSMNGKWQKNIVYKERSIEFHYYDNDMHVNSTCFTLVIKHTDYKERIPLENSICFPNCYGYFMLEKQEFQ